LLVKDAVALAPQIGTAETILAISAIVKKPRIGASDAIPAEKHPIAVGNIGTVVAELVPMGDVKIGRVFYIPHPIGIKRPLASKRAGNQVAVFALVGYVAIIAVRRVGIRNAHQRKLVPKLQILLEKRLVEIVIAAAFKLIPIVAIKTIVAINLKRRRRVKNADFFFLA